MNHIGSNYVKLQRSKTQMDDWSLQQTGLQTHFLIDPGGRKKREKPAKEKKPLRTSKKK